MENSLRSSESLRNVNSLIQKIEGICKDIEASLSMCLNVTADSVATYSITTANKVESEFVNIVCDNIKCIKNHLEDLKKALRQNKLEGVHTIIGSLQDTSSILQSFLLANNFYNNTFQLPVMEIQATIDQIFEEVALPVSAMAD